MLAEERERPLLRQIVVLLAETAALVAAEAVAGAGIDVDLRLRLRRADRVHVLHRDRLVGFAEMHLHRAVRPLVLGAGDAAAVPAGGGREGAAARRPPPGHRAAETVADDAELLPARCFAAASTSAMICASVSRIRYARPL